MFDLPSISISNPDAVAIIEPNKLSSDELVAKAAYAIQQKTPDRLIRVGWDEITSHYVITSEEKPCWDS